MEMQKHVIKQYTNRLPNLKTAEEISEKVQVGPDRLISLAKAGYCPHYRIDDQEPMFQLKETKSWICKNLLSYCEGKELPINFKVFVKKDINIIDRPPDAIRLNKDLIQVDIHYYPPGVYFLCNGDEVVYVGQSINIFGRLVEHRQNKNFDRIYILPIPEHELNAVEGALIRILKPKYNRSNKRTNGVVAPPNYGKIDDRNVLIKHGISVRKFNLVK